MPSYGNIKSVCLRYRRGVERKEYRQIQVASSNRAQELFFKQHGVDINLNVTNTKAQELYKSIVSCILNLYPDVDRKLLNINASKLVSDLIRTNSYPMNWKIFECLKWRVTYLMNKLFYTL